MVVARGSKCVSLYITRARVCDGIVNAVEGEGTTELWHSRLSHISEKGLMILSKKNLLPGMSCTPLKKCEHCLAGKQTRISFKSSPPSRKPEILDLVYYDVCGPMKRRTLGGALYFVT